MINKIEEIGQKFELKKVTLIAGILTALGFLFGLINMLSSGFYLHIGGLLDTLSKGAISVFLLVLYSKQSE